MMQYEIRDMKIKIKEFKMLNKKKNIVGKIESV